MRKFSVVMILMSFLLPGVLIGGEPLDPKVKKELEDGGIVMKIEQNPITKVYAPTGQALVNADVENVWNVITDFDSFGEFLPNVVYYRPVGWKDGRLYVDCRIKVVLMTFDYQLNYIVNEKEHTTYWFYVKGPIRDSQGYFRVEPYDNGRSLVTYTTTLDIGKAVPGFIKESLSKSTFPKIFKSLRRQVEGKMKKGPILKPLITDKAYVPKDSAMLVKK